MASETNQGPGRTGKKIRRVRIGFNVLAQIVLVLFLVAMVNSIAFKHYARWDFSRDQKYALSDKTKRFLDTLKGKMRITIFFPPSTPITTDVQNLLTEYQYAGKGKVDIEHIDPERNLSRAKELFDKYKVVT
ncbi:MAG TPA: Gldg family protein, partial [Candidatus Udaeobacter sp.]|nr:Gldg family protein [Candidatus Udaeobacter sp.]